MSQSAQDQIESIVRCLEEKGASASPVMEATALATTHPDAVTDLAIVVMRRFPKGSTFLDAAFSYMPQDKWPEIVKSALDTLEQCNGKNDAAESVIEYASLECHSALHPHLDRILMIRPNCPLCNKLMTYMLQLDSDLPTEDGGEWLWGSGGIAYGFWCDDCGVSGFLWQCT